MIFIRGQVFLCSNGTWRKVTGINRWKNEIYYISNCSSTDTVYTIKNMAMQFWCTYHDVREVANLNMAILSGKLDKLTQTAQLKGLHFAQKQIQRALG